MCDAALTNKNTIFGNDIILSVTAYIFFPSMNVSFLCDLIILLCFCLNFYEASQKGYIELVSNHQNTA